MIFKKGDKVYDHAYGWGEVEEIVIGHVYPLKCEFGDYRCTYTKGGSVIDVQLPTLSFTEYTLEGFSQVRSKEPLPFKVGDVVYLSDSLGGTWATTRLTRIDKKGDKPFAAILDWRCLALENPILNPDTKIYTKEDL
tara:strand:+ start:23388 stop:23798 length:411 start_codon:yes stop_codon:yes gene_type:complete